MAAVNAGVCVLVQSSGSRGTGQQDKGSARVLAFPGQYWMSISNSCNAMPYLSSLPEVWGVFRRDLRTSWSV